MHIAVTGASSGIGAALAREWLSRGASVTLVARRAELLNKIASEAPGRAHCAPADLGDLARCLDWIKPAEEALGPIDVLVNNAGVELVAKTAEVPWDKAEALLRVNLLAPLKINRALLPGMIARGRGCIVDVASAAALTTPPGFYFYGASKAGLAAASESLRAEVQGAGVHVVTVYPGPIATDMGERAMTEVEERLSGLRRLLAKTAPWGSPARLASLVADAVEQKKPRVIFPRFYALQRWLGPLSRWVTDASMT